MAPIFLAVAISVSLYVLVVALLPQHVLTGSTAYTQGVISRLRTQNLQRHITPRRSEDDAPMKNPLVRAFLLIPGMQRAVPLFQRAFIWQKLDQFVLGCILLFLSILFCTAKTFGVMAIPFALLLAWLLALIYLHHRVRSRRSAFVEQFPEVLDVIVRSVRVGHPLSAAIQAISENVPPPTGTEFRRVADEVHYGAPLMEALERLTDRIDDPDIRFFAVVLSIQQETGGNIAETLANLASLLRKRRQMRLTIKALSSEGRATAWIVGLIPFVFVGIITYIAPNHTQVLFNTVPGQFLLACTLGLMAVGTLVMRQITHMEV